MTDTDLEAAARRIDELEAENRTLRNAAVTATERAALAAPTEQAASDDGADKCGCRQCLRDRDEHVMFGDIKIPVEGTRMILCAICGNKRCPHATDHRHACTGSNEPGQPGSVY